MTKLWRPIGIVLTCAVLASCTHPVQRRLQGRWFGESVENVDVGQLASVTAWVRGTSFEFRGSEVTIAIPGELPRSAPYAVVAAAKSRVTIQVQRENGGLDVARFSLDDDHLMRWHLADNRAVLLRRAQ